MYSDMVDIFQWRKDIVTHAKTLILMPSRPISTNMCGRLLNKYVHGRLLPKNLRFISQTNQRNKFPLNTNTHIRIPLGRH